MWKLIFPLIFLSAQVYGAKILIVFNVVSRSHSNIGHALGIGLAKSGHEVQLYNVLLFLLNLQHWNYKHICYKIPLSEI